uniref:Polyprotein n=1 Tax=Wanghe virus TaxID=3141828 RepID=A0AAU6SJ94_9VIRU
MKWLQGVREMEQELLDSTELSENDATTETWYSAMSELFVMAKDTLVSAVITSLKFLGTFVEKIKPAVVHISSSVINFLVALFQITQSNSKFMTGVLAASMLASFSSFIVGVTSACGGLALPWYADAAVHASRCVVDDLIKKTKRIFDREFQENANLDAPMLVKAGISTIVVVLIAGLGLTKSVPWRDLLTHTSLIGRMRDACSTVNGVAEYILGELFGYEQDKDYAACQELEALVKQGSRLQSLSAAHFIQHPNDLVALQKFTEQIVKVTTSPLSRDVSQRYHTTKQLLVQMYRVLYDKLSTVNAILETKQRQVTIGVVLSGKPGVGKSELCRYLAKKIGERLGYNPAIYTLNKKSDGFFEPYGGHSFGIYNEWMAMRSEDPLLRDLNLIFSSDPMNFEGAALDCKTQPCRLKLAFLTSNDDNPELTRVLNEGAAQAVWDRMYHVHVADDRCRGRGFPNTHRQPDFSHLTFHKVDHTNLLTINDGREFSDTTRITMQQLLQRLIGRCSAAELDHIRGLLADPMDDDIRTTLARRREVLNELLRTNSPFDSVPASSNAWGREFFIYRFQGLPGTGKTTLCEQVSREFASILGYQIQYSVDQDQFRPYLSEPFIYVLDDWVETCDYQKYLEQINSTHEKSIIFICSNTVFQQSGIPWSRPVEAAFSLFEMSLSWLSGTKKKFPIDATKFEGPLGVLRRLGLDGMVRMPDGNCIIMNPSYSRTYTFGNKYTIRDGYGSVENCRTICDTIFSSYQKFLTEPGDLLILKKTPPIVQQVSISLQATDLDSIMTCLKSYHQMNMAFLGRHSTVRMIIQPDMLEIGPQTSLGMWHVPEDTPHTPEQIEDVFKRLCILFEKAAPGRAMEVVIEDTGMRYYYAGHVGYIYSPDEDREVSPIEYLREGIRFNRGGSFLHISTDDLIAFKLFRQFPGNLSKLRLSELLIMDREIVSKMRDGQDVTPFKINYLAKYHVIKQRSLPLYLKFVRSFRDHPVFWIACSLISVMGLSAVLTKLVGVCAEWWTKKKTDIVETEPIYANTYDKDRGPQPKNILIRAVPKINSWPNEKSTEQAVKQIRVVRANTICADAQNMVNRALKSGIVREPQVEQISSELDDIYQLRVDPDNFTNEIVSALPGHEKETHLLWKASHAYHSFPDVKPDTEFGRVMYQNMLSADDMIKQSYTTVENFQKSLTNCYFRVINKYGGTCYGIGMFGKFVLTVGHMCTEVFEDAIIQSQGKQYRSRVVYLDRERDLAVVQVLDKTFPSVKSTERLFHDKSHLKDALYGYYIRCGPDCQVGGGYMSFYETCRYPITDMDNPNFSVRDKIIVFTMIGCHKVRDLVHKGDCGFPLVSSAPDGTYKIIGIHNAYADIEKVYFSSVTQQDWHQILEAAIRAAGNNEEFPMGEVEIDGVPGSFLVPQPYVDALDDVYLNDTYEEYSDALDIVGWVPKLRFKTRPRVKDVFMDLPGMKTINYKLPAAVNLDHVTSVKGLVKDSRGRPDPLFTQCIKYDKRIGYTYDPELLNQAATRVMEDMLASYGKCKILRLHEVINGCVSEPLSAFDPRTSAGPLLKMLYHVHNKLPLFTTTDNPSYRVLAFNHTEPARMVRSHYAAYVKSLFEGGPPPLLISKDCAKVELIDAIKAKAGKVRLFNEVDLSINMVLKKFFGDFQNKVMLKHHDFPIKMGQNPYKEATRIWQNFSRIDGNIISTDFSGFDKQLPAILIYCFCYISGKMTYTESTSYDEHLHREIYERLAQMLIYALHTCNGYTYIVDRGNESGTFVTTLMNSVCVRILTMYTVIRKWNIIFHYTPTLSDILQEYDEAIYGDDRTAKFSKALCILQSDLVEDSKKFGLSCTPAKTTGVIDFCSRSFEWDPVRQIAFPALKRESVLSQIRWFKSFDRQQVIDNIDNCLFEAALHSDKSIFEDALHDAILIIDYLKLQRSDIQFLSRTLIRRRFIAYVFDLEEYTWLTRHVERENINETYFCDLVSEYNKKAIGVLPQVTLSTDPKEYPSRLVILRKLLATETAVMPNPHINPVSAVLEALVACRFPDKPEDQYSINNDDGVFTYITRLFGKQGKGVAGSKKEAKRIAYRELYFAIQDKIGKAEADTKPNILQARINADKCSKSYMYKAIQCHLGLASVLHRKFGKPIIVLAAKIPNLDWKVVEVIRYGLDQEGNIYLPDEVAGSFRYDELAPIYLVQPSTVECGRKISFDPNVTRANMDKNVHGAGNLVQDTVVNPGLGTIPNMTNVVPVTETAPAMIANDPPTMAAYEPLMPVMNLNPSGPPNMLSAGAIAFDIKDLAYNQFMDCNTLYSYLDKQDDGQIIFQIPYDPTSNFVNPYAKTYVKMHERFAGDMEFRFTVVGNQTFSGFICMCWYPRKVTGTNMTLSEAMKYNYVAESINQPFSCIFRLNDARQELFWRRVADTKDVDSRPHLICFVVMTTQSPLKEGATVRIRVASKLCSNFQVSNPQIATTPEQTTAAGLYTSSYKRMQGQPVVPNIVRPFYPNTTNFHLVMDGNMFAPTAYVRTSDYSISNWQANQLGESGKLDFLAVKYDPKFPVSSKRTIIFTENSAGQYRAFVVHLDRLDDAFSNVNPYGAPVILSQINKAIDEFKSNSDQNKPDKIFQLFIKRTGAHTALVWNLPDKFDINGKAQNPKPQVEGEPQLDVIDYPWIGKKDTQWGGMLFFEKGVVAIYSIQTDLPGPVHACPAWVTGFNPTQVRKVIYQQVADALPAGWRRVVITPDLPYVAVEGMVSSYMMNHVSLEAMLGAIGESIPPTQCLQIEISDYESAAPIATVRYLPDRRTMVINIGDQRMLYATSLRGCERMYIASIALVERSNAFPLTQLGGAFADNQVHPSIIGHQLFSCDPFQ